MLRGFVEPHSHDAKDSLDQALEGSSVGIRAVAISLVLLLATAGLQALVVVASGSVALLGDTLHNAADALTAVPLWLAFRLGRRATTARFTYGFGKAEDVAGLAVIGLIAVSAGLAGYEAITRLLHPQNVTHLGFVMAAAVVGAVGNEVVAQYRIRVGRRIGSAALEADGIHARTRRGDFLVGTCWGCRCRPWGAVGRPGRGVDHYRHDRRCWLSGCPKRWTTPPRCR